MEQWRLKKYAQAQPFPCWFVVFYCLCVFFEHGKYAAITWKAIQADHRLASFF
jgi:hypothetical protein